MSFPRRVLALLCDGFQVEAALLLRRKGAWHAEASLRLPWNFSPEELLARAEELDPRHTAAVVASVPEAVLAQVDLPVPPGGAESPLPQTAWQRLLPLAGRNAADAAPGQEAAQKHLLTREEMEQLLSWELGPLVAQASRAPTLPEALWGLGLLAEEALFAQAPEGSPGAGSAFPAGEELLQHLVATGRLEPERAEQLRQWVAGHPGPPAEEALVCRYVPWQDASARAASSAEELSQGEVFPWLVTAAPAAIVDRWQQAVEATGREFLGLVPLCCCAWAAVQEGPLAEQPSAEVELVLPGRTVRLHFQKGALQRVENLPGRFAEAGSFGVAPDSAGPAAESPAQTPARLRFGPLALARGGHESPGELSPRQMLHGLVAWAAGTGPEAQALSPLRRPVPWVPPWQRPRWIAAACVGAWLLVLLGLELPLRARLHQARQHEAALRHQVERLEEAKEREEARLARLKRLQQKRDQLQKELQLQQQTVARVQAAFHLRRRRVPELLERLRQLVPAELVLDALHWDARDRLTLQGWATGAEVVRQFEARVLEHLSDAAPAVLDDVLEQAPGPGGVPGVRFSFVVALDLAQVPPEPVASNAAKPPAGVSRELATHVPRRTAP